MAKTTPELFSFPRLLYIHMRVVLKRREGETNEEKGTGHCRRITGERNAGLVERGKEGGVLYKLNWWYSTSVSMETLTVDIHKRAPRKRKVKKKKVKSRIHNLDHVGDDE